MNIHLILILAEPKRHYRIIDIELIHFQSFEVQFLEIQTLLPPKKEKAKIVVNYEFGRIISISLMSFLT